MRRTLIALLSLVALVAAGCGGGGSSSSDNGKASKQEYSHELSQATAGLQKAFEELAKGTAPSKDGGTKDAGVRLTRGAAALDQAASDFAKIDPPKDSAAAHRKLVDGLHELADVFRKGAEAAKRNDAKGLAKTLQGLATSPGARKITEAQRELLRVGVKVTTTS